MNLIVAVDNNWAIGKDNDLLIKIPQDLYYFSEKTTNNIVVMGRKTLESFPRSKPLRDRINIVISTKEDYKVEGGIVLHSVDEALEEVKQYKSEDVYIIGGQTVYEQFLDYCDTAYVTKINYSYDADTFFPNLDDKEEWEIKGVSDEQTYYDIEYKFYKYKNNKTRTY